MKKTKIILLLMCLIALPVTLFAQSNDEKKKEDFEKFKEQRKAYISQIMNLTESESVVFWPLCNEFQEKKFELNKTLRAEIRKIHEAKKAGKTVSAADYKKVVELGASVKLKEAQLESEYLTKFLTVLPAEKVYLYQQAEYQFAKTMFGDRKKGKS